MIYPDTMKDEYDAFVTGMVTEYNKHWNKDGDSWKILKSTALYDLLDGSSCEYKDLLKNPNHLFDIANYAMFLWYNIQKEQSDNIMNSVQCPECGEWVKKEEFDLHLMKTRPDIVIEQLTHLRGRVNSLEKDIIEYEKSSDEIIIFKNTIARLEHNRDVLIDDMENIANERDKYRKMLDNIKGVVEST
jgi:hypothetical protein